MPSYDSSVLIAEDFAPVRFLFSTVLRHAGFQVHTASDGEEALALLPIVRPALLLTDLEFGSDLHGMELIPAARRDYPELRILAVSARDDLWPSEKVLAAGADRHLTKPLPNQVLLQHVRELLE